MCLYTIQFYIRIYLAHTKCIYIRFFPHELKPSLSSTSQSLHNFQIDKLSVFSLPKKKKPAKSVNSLNMFKLKKQPTIDWIKIRTTPSKKFLSKIIKILGFDYVVKRLPPAKICFGTTLKRNVVPLTEIKSMSPLMVRFLPKSAAVCQAPTLPKIASATSTIGSTSKGAVVSVNTCATYVRTFTKK